MNAPGCYMYMAKWYLLDFFYSVYLYLCSFFLLLARLLPLFSLSLLNFVAEIEKNPLLSYVYRCVLCWGSSSSPMESCAALELWKLFFSRANSMAVVVVLFHTQSTLQRMFLLCFIYLHSCPPATQCIPTQCNAMLWNCKNPPDKIQLIIYECHLKK